MSEIFRTERYVALAAKEEDIPYIMEQERKEENRDYVFQNSFEEHKKLIDSNHAMVLIVKDNDSMENIGFIICDLDRDSDRFELRRIVIEAKNRGAGRELVKGLMDHAFKKMDINRFWLDVFNDNTRAIHLYESLGMTHEGTLRQGYKDYKGEYRDQLIYAVLKSDFKILI